MTKYTDHLHLVTFSALSDDSSTAKEAKVSGYTVHDEDDLDDLFDKQEGKRDSYSNIIEINMFN